VSFSYDQQLINETVECFRIEYDHIISPEQAVEYLDSLGGLFLAFAGGSAFGDSPFKKGLSPLGEDPLS